MSFFITFLIASSAFYISKVAEEEMVIIFAGIVAFLGFVMSLILAPWYVQISILIFVLIWQSPHR